MSHNYPEIIVACWTQVSSTIHGFFRLASPEVPARSWKGNVGNVLPIGEKVITAAIKVRYLILCALFYLAYLFFSPFQLGMVSFLRMDSPI